MHEVPDEMLKKHNNDTQVNTTGKEMQELMGKEKNIKQKYNNKINFLMNLKHHLLYKFIPKSQRQQKQVYILQKKTAILGNDVIKIGIDLVNKMEELKNRVKELELYTNQ